MKPSEIKNAQHVELLNDIIPIFKKFHEKVNEEITKELRQQRIHKDVITQYLQLNGREKVELVSYFLKVHKVIEGDYEAITDWAINQSVDQELHDVYFHEWIREAVGPIDSKEVGVMILQDLSHDQKTRVSQSVKKAAKNVIISKKCEKALSMIQDAVNDEKSFNSLVSSLNEEKVGFTDYLFYGQVLGYAIDELVKENTEANMRMLNVLLSSKQAKKMTPEIIRRVINNAQRADNHDAFEKLVRNQGGKILDETKSKLNERFKRVYDDVLEDLQPSGESVRGPESDFGPAQRRKRSRRPKEQETSRKKSKKWPLTS